MVLTGGSHTRVLEVVELRTLNTDRSGRKQKEPSDHVYLVYLPSGRTFRGRVRHGSVRIARLLCSVAVAQPDRTAEPTQPNACMRARALVRACVRSRACVCDHRRIVYLV